VTCRPAIRCGYWEQDTLCLPVRVITRSARAQLGAVENGRLKLRLTAPPVDGKANQQARKLLARAFGVGVTRITLARGETARNKLFRIDQPVKLPAELLPE